MHYSACTRLGYAARTFARQEKHEAGRKWLRQRQPIQAARRIFRRRRRTSRAPIISRTTFLHRISRPAAPARRPTSMPMASWTYGQLADRVARFGAALRAKGIRREERILICLLDTIDWPTAFLGALKAGVIAIPVNTLMTEADYEFMLADSRVRMLVVSEALYPKFASLIAKSPDLQHVVVSGDNAQGHDRFEDLISQAKPEDYTAPTTRDDIALLALHLGLDRQAQGRRACACESEIHQRSLCRADPRAERERCLLFGRQAVLRLWSRQCDDLSDVGRRHHRAAGRSADAGWRCRAASQASGDGVLRRADLLCRLPGEPKICRPARRRNSAAACRPAKRCLPMSASAGATKYGCDILDGIGSTEMLHIFLSNAPGATKYGTTGKPVPGYELKLIDDHGQQVAAGEMGELHHPRADLGDHVLEQPRAVAPRLHGRMDALGRQVSAGRGWLLRLLRPQRRHAEGLRPLCVAVRGRGRAADPSTTCSNARWSPGSTATV